MADYDAQPGRTTAPEPDLSAAQREADDVDLYAGLSGVAGLVAGARGVIELLGDVAEFAAQAIPGVDGAGVTVIDTCGDTPSVKTWAVTAEFVEDIDKLQYVDLERGARASRVCSRGGPPSADRWEVTAGGRASAVGWPGWACTPRCRCRCWSAISVIGAINTYAHSRDAFGEHAVELGSQFAGPAAVSVYNAQLLDGAQERTEQLQRALGTRAVIDQAIGIIRSRSGSVHEVAFDRLVRMSQAENTSCMSSPSGWSRRPCGAP